MSHLIIETKLSKIYRRDMSLFGAFPRSDSLLLKLKIPRALGTTAAALLIHADALDFPYEPEKRIELSWKALELDSDIYEGCLDLAELRGSAPERRLFYYKYELACTEGLLYFGGEQARVLTPCEEAGDRQLLLFDDGYKTSRHFKNGIIYHIFVDRFKKSGKCAPRGEAVLDPDWDNGIPQYGEYPGAKVKNNVFFGGDLYGVADELDYIASLGAKTIYLSPIFEAASNHKYDTGDYLTVDSMFGGDEALAELLEKAKKRGIEIILDGVFNHTGSDSIYFNREGHYPKNGAFNTEKSPFYKWYSFEKYPDKYECWWGVDILPRVNSSDSSYKSFIFGSVIPKWMRLGVGGWRLDVADELDSDFLTELRKAVRRLDSDAPIIGEVWEDATNKISYGLRRKYMQGGQLDGVMNYPLREAVIDFIRDGSFAKLKRITEGMYRRYPKQASDSMMNFLGSHDTERILTVLGGRAQGEMTNRELSTAFMSELQRKNAIKLLKLAYALIVAYPGVPCVFYGDEVGSEGYRDPFCRRPFPWSSMEKGLLEYYRRLGEIRSTEKLFIDGEFENVFASDTLYVCRRTPWNNENYFLLIVINRSDRALTLRFSNEASELINGEIGREIQVDSFSAAYIKLPLTEPILPF